MGALMNKRAFTLVEILIAMALGIVLIGAVFNAYNLVRPIYTVGLARQGLQDGANTVINKILTGKTEVGGIYRLPEAVSFVIVAIDNLSFVGQDGSTRSYRLNGAATQVIYNHPSGAGAVDEVVYTAPTGSVITLRFSNPGCVNCAAVAVQIDVSLTQTVSGRAVSGSASTIVNVRNHL